MKKVQISIIVSLFLLGFLFVLTSFASEDEKTKAISMVEEAAKMMKADGKDKTLSAINDPKGKFVNGEIYVFAYDLNGVIIAHPQNPKLVGKNMLEVPDVDGKLFRKDIVEIARKKATGWVDYKYKNPATGKIELKTTYVMGVDDVAICCGIYKK